jgi:hypothetical protein
VLAALGGTAALTAFGLIELRSASAHHPEYTATVDCDGNWTANGDYIGGAGRRLVLISEVAINGMPYDPGWSNVNDDPAHDDAGDGGSPAGTDQVVSYSSYGGAKPAALGDPATNYLWVGVAFDWIVFELFGANFTTNWGGTITQYEWNGSVWEQGGGDPDPGAGDDAAGANRLRDSHTPADTSAHSHADPNQNTTANANAGSHSDANGTTAEPTAMSVESPPASPTPPPEPTPTPTPTATPSPTLTGAPPSLSPTALPEVQGPSVPVAVAAEAQSPGALPAAGANGGPLGNGRAALIVLIVGIATALAGGLLVAASRSGRRQ